MAFFVSAVVAAVEVTTVATVSLAVSEVGIALSVAGAVTGNANLSKIGGVMALAGGVTGLANSAFDAATTTAATSAASDATAQTADQAVNTVSTDAPITDSSTMPVSSPSPTDITNLSTDTATSSNLPLADPSANNGIISNATNAGLNPATPAPIPGASGASSLTGAPSSAVTQPVASLTPTDAPVAPAGSPAVSTPAAGSSVAPTAPTAPSVTAAPEQTAQAQNAFQLGNQSTATMNSGSANMVSGSQMAGVNAPTSPNSASALFNSSSPSLGGNLGDGVVAPSASSPSGDYFSGVKNLFNTPVSGGTQLLGGVLQGAGQGYAGMKQYELGQGQLGIMQQNQSNLSQQPTMAGIVAAARKNKTSGS